MSSAKSRFLRGLWSVVWRTLFWPSPRPAHAWRAGLLRLFGARLGPHCHIYAGARIWAPWNLRCDDAVAIADGAVVYNVAAVHLASHAIVSQEAFLCSATHDPDDPDFALLARPITIGCYAWIGARATVAPGVTVGDGAVLGLCSLATADLAPWTIYAGVPARALRPRQRVGNGAPAVIPAATQRAYSEPVDGR